MSFEKYYDILFENGKLNDEYVTYLTYKHIENSLLNKDFNSNNSIYDLMKNYSNKFNQMLNKIEAPLGFLFDDVYDLYCFTKPHLDNILDNPKQSIIKESKLVRKEKLKQIEPKTITWLATKQGSTFREKIGQLNKIKTNVKRFSYNIPANQVVLSYYNRLYKLMNQKLSVIKENPNLFGAYDTKEINELQKQLYKLRNKVKEVFYEVDPKELIKANNTLLGNPDYRSVWNSNVDLKKYNINYEDSFLKFVDSLFECVVLSFMQELDSIEGSFNLDDIFGATLYSLNDNTLFVVEFEKNESLIIKTKAFKLNEGLLKIVDEKDFVVSIQREESNDGIGIPFLVKINGIPKGEFYGNLLGVKEVLNTINDTFQMNFGRKSLVKTNETNIEFVSINSYDNMAYGKDDLTVLLIDDHKDFIPNELYF